LRGDLEVRIAVSPVCPGPDRGIAGDSSGHQRCLLAFGHASIWAWQRCPYCLRRHLDTVADPHAFSHLDTHRHTYACAHGDGYPHPNRYRDCDAHCNPHAYTDSDTHSNLHSYFYANPHAHADTPSPHA
jgi:hypothetical protein